MPSTLAAGNEDDIALAGVDIVVFEDEELVDAVFLELRDLHNRADRAHEAPIKDHILLAADLR